MDQFGVTQLLAKTLQVLYKLQFTTALLKTDVHLGSLTPGKIMWYSITKSYRLKDAYLAKIVLSRPANLTPPFNN